MDFDTRLKNEREITCSEQDSNPRLPVTSRPWHPLYHRVNHAGYVATYWSVWIERSQSTGHFSFETFLCVSWLNPKLNLAHVTDRNFLKQRKPCKRWKKDVIKLQMAFDTHRWNERKITCPELACNAGVFCERKRWIILRCCHFGCFKFIFLRSPMKNFWIRTCVSNTLWAWVFFFFFAGPFRFFSSPFPFLSLCSFILVIFYYSYPFCCP